MARTNPRTKPARDELARPGAEEPNPVWFKPVMFGFMLLGLIWIIVFYVSQGQYPVPTLGRDRALAVVQPWLMSHGIWSRGRFGAWRYEIGNTDHSVMMGVELADHLVTGKPETTWALPAGAEARATIS